MPSNAIVYWQIIKFVAEGTSATTGGFNRVGAAADKLTGGFKNLAGAFTAVMAAGRIKSFLSGLIQPAIDLEGGMVKLKTITGASATMMGQFKKEVLQAAAATAYSPLEAIDTLVRLRQATMNDKTAIDALTPSLVLASASFGDLVPKQTAEMMGQMIRGFRFTGTEASMAADHIYRLAISGGLKIKDFADVLASLGNTAFHSGNSFKDMTTFFAISRNTMHSSKLTARELDIALTQLQKSSRDPVTGKTKGVRELMVGYYESWKKNAANTKEQLASDIKSAAGRKAVLAALGNMTEGMVAQVNGASKKLYGAELWDFLFGAKGAKGGIEEAKKAYIASIGGQMEILAETWWSAKAALAGGLLPALRTTVEVLKGALSTFIKLADNPFFKVILSKISTVVAFTASIFAIRAAFWGINQIMASVYINVSRANVATGLWATKTKIALTHMSMVSLQMMNWRQKSGAPLIGPMTSGQDFAVALRQAAASNSIMEGVRSKIGAVGATAGRAASAIGRAAGAFVTGLGPTGWLMVAITLLPELNERLQKSWRIAMNLREVFKSMNTGSMFTNMAVAYKTFIVGDKDAIKRYGEAAMRIEMKRYAVQAAEYKVLEKQREMFDSARSTLKEAHNWMQIGTSQFNGILDRIEKINKHEKQTLNLGTFASTITRLRGISGRVGGGDNQKHIESVLRQAQGLASIINLSRGPNARPLGSHEAMMLSAGLGAIETELDVLSSSGAIPKSVRDLWRKNLSMPSITALRDTERAGVEARGLGGASEMGFAVPQPRTVIDDAFDILKGVYFDKMGGQSDHAKKVEEAKVIVAQQAVADHTRIIAEWTKRAKVTIEGGESAPYDAEDLKQPNYWDNETSALRK